MNLTKHILNRKLFDEVLDQARNSPRRRMNFNFHGSMEENPHRFLNVMLRDTYITPHRHTQPPKAESFLVIEGRIAFFTFDDDGRVASAEVLDAEMNDGLPVGVDISPGFWHTLVVLSEHAVCFEVKPGPYIPTNDKEFAPWAPHEGDASADELSAYREKLLKHVE